MNKKKDPPLTTALRHLQDAGLAYVPHEYPYEERGGTAHSSACLGVPEHQVIKTLVMENERKEAFIILMHGDREVSTKALARQIGCRTVAPCDPRDAQRHSGYQVGGTSPFGTRKVLPVYVEKSILALDRILINGGRRGLLVEISPETLSALNPIPVEASQAD
jgi:Cys-tRNA(Pro) deacylase